MERSQLRALSPADGRYADKVNSLRDILSEFGLIRYRVMVEVRWLQWMADEPSIPELPPLSSVMKDVLNAIVDNFTTDDAERVKAIETTTNHDVKAVEYFIREKIGTGSEYQEPERIYSFWLHVRGYQQPCVRLDATHRPGRCIAAADARSRSETSFNGSRLCCAANDVTNAWPNGKSDDCRQGNSQRY